MSGDIYEDGDPVENMTNKPRTKTKKRLVSKKLQVGDAIQLNPHHLPSHFAGCLAVVAAIDGDAVSCYISVPVAEGKPTKPIWLRVPKKAAVKIGLAPWINDGVEMPEFKKRERPRIIVPGRPKLVM